MRSEAADENLLKSYQQQVEAALEQAKEKAAV